MNERVEPADDIGIAGVLSLLWRRKLIIAATTGVGLVAALLGYLVLPQIYESTVDIRPIRQVQYSNYLTLAGAGVFPQSRTDLLDEYMFYLQDRTLLSDAAIRTEVVSRQNLDDAAYRERVLLFVNSISFTRPSKEEPLVRMDVRADNQTKLKEFVTMAHSMAKQQFSQQLHMQVVNRLNARKETEDIEARVIANEIKARREKAEAERKDRIERLQQLATIARLLDLDKPLGVRSTTSPPSEGVSVQILQAEGSGYLQGYIALEEQIEQLKTRRNNDPFVGELRELEQEEFQIRNNPTVPRLTEFLDQLGWTSAEGVDLVYLDTLNLTVWKIFPRLSVFASFGILMGFLLGVACVLLRPILKPEMDRIK